VADAAGNTNSCATSFTVVDTTPPAIVCPGNVTVTGALGTFSNAVTFGAAVVSDNSGVATNFCVPASGSFFPYGTNPVLCTAVDVAGNTNQCAFTVTVNRPVGPDLTGAPLLGLGTNGWEAAICGTFKNPVTGNMVSLILGAFDVQNIGLAPAGGSVARFYLSPTATFDLRTAILLTNATHAVPALATNAMSTVLFGIVAPPGVTLTNQYLIAVVNATGVVAESNESNNILVWGLLEDYSTRVALQKFNKTRQLLRANLRKLKIAATKKKNEI